MNVNVVRELPTAKTVDECFLALQAAFDVVERVTWDVDSIARLDEPDAATPVVTYAKIGVVAAIAEDVDRRGRELQEFAERLRASIGGLSATRQIQTAQDGAAGG